MKTIRNIFWFCSLIILIAFSCEKENAEYINTEGYIIGFDPCEGGTITKDRGFVITCNNFNDTLVTYNFPDTIFEFPQYLFENYAFNFLFPNTEYLNYKIKLQYRFSSEKEKYYPLCRGDINTWGFSHFIKDRQIIINRVQVLTK